MATRQRKATYHIDIEKGTMTAKVVGSGTLVCDARDLPGVGKLYDGLPELGKHVFMHGIKQKVPDTAAALHGKDAYQAMKSQWASLCKGEWSDRSGSRANSVRAEAASRVWSVAPEVAAGRLDAMAEDELKKFVKSHTYKLEKARVELARLVDEEEAAA